MNKSLAYYSAPIPNRPRNGSGSIARDRAKRGDFGSVLAEVYNYHFLLSSLCQNHDGPYVLPGNRGGDLQG
jgi:hypothetical protein